jgi:hypothetical protein
MKTLIHAGLLALAASAAPLPRTPSASAAICGSAICATPGSRGIPRCTEMSGGRVLTVWNDGTPYAVRAMLSDSAGRPAWPFPDGVQLGPDGLLLQDPPLLCRLAPNAVLEAHSSQASPNGPNVVVISAIWSQTEAPSESLRAQAEVLPQPSGVTSRSVNALVRQDDAHALLVLRAARGASAPYFARIEPAAIPGSGPSLWPAEGVVLSDTCAIVSLGACPDGAMGCFVLAKAAHACMPQPFQTCPSELRLYHLLADGSRDPSWASAGFEITRHPGWDGTGQVVSDGQGGAYVGWWETINDTLRVVGLRVMANATVAAGWDRAGLILLRSNTLVQGDFRIAASPTGNLVAAVPIYLRTGLRAIERDPAGNVAAGWPESGVSLIADTPYAGYEVEQLNLQVAPDGRVVTAWAQTSHGSTITYSVRGVALSSTGERLSGWPDVGRVICDQRALDVSLAAPTDNTFTVVWRDTDIRLASCAISDLSTPTLASAVLIGHDVQGSYLTATWRLSASGSLAFGAVRSVDGGPFLPIDAPTRTGSDELVLTDSLPSAIASTRYAISVRTGAEDQIVSEVLEIPVDPTKRDRPSLGCPAVQGGPAVAFELASWPVNGSVLITLFDLAGRRVEHATVEVDAAGHAHGRIECKRVSPGVYVLQACDRAGTQASQRLVRIR